jgi:RNA polymerase sigma-70 factor, ECF subfamily
LLESQRMNGEPRSAGSNGRQRFTSASLADPKKRAELAAIPATREEAAPEKLAPLVYDELRRLAHHYMEGQSPDHTLQTTALVNEAYLRLAGQKRPNFVNRSHFLAVAAKAMRQILVDHAKACGCQKRGAGARKVELDEGALISPQPAREILDLNEALESLARLDPRKAQVVELRYFGGLNQDEIADVLKVSTVTVRRDWTFAKAWLYAELHTPANHAN